MYTLIYTKQMLHEQVSMISYFDHMAGPELTDSTFDQLANLPVKHNRTNGIALRLRFNRMQDALL